MALDQDKIAPLTQPKSPAFAKVMMKAGNGATTDCNTISIKDTIGAHTPNERMYSFTPDLIFS